MLDFNQTIAGFRATNNILILPSQPADGDSLGSALALYLSLKSMGKNATVVLSAETPEVYRFLPGVSDIVAEAKVYSDFVVTIDLKDIQVNNIEHHIVDNKVNIIVSPNSGTILAEQVSFPTPEKKYDLLVIVDAADLSQLGNFYKQNKNIFSEVPSINIDHHKSNNMFASVNLVDENACSTTQIVYDLLKQLGTEITPDIATLLLTGIITDTGSFQNENTSPEAFDIAAELIDQGGRQQEIIKFVYKTKQLQTLKLWGKILSNIQVDSTNKIVWSTVSNLDNAETGTTEKDTGDIIDDLIANAEEADIVLLLSEHSDGSVHGSIRTTNDSKDAAALAAKFGGGGHARAAGFTIPNSNLTLAEPQVLETIRNFEQVTPTLQTDPIVTANDPAELLTQEQKIEQLAKEFVSKPENTPQNPSESTSENNSENS